MKRVVQRTIDQNFFPVPAEIFAAGSTIPFDCYIKRYNGYAVIIEAGTLLNEALIAKVSRHEHCYVVQEQRTALSSYREAHKDVSRESGEELEVSPVPPAEVEALPHALEQESDTQRQIDLLYGSGSALLGGWFGGSSEILPAEGLTRYSAILADYIASKAYRLHAFLSVMPASYSNASHSLNVAILAGILARAVGIDAKQLEAIVFAGLLHDVGKIRIPDRILLKDAALDSDEFEKMKEHPAYGVAILKKNRLGSASIFPAVLYHHEKRDGSGYPEGLLKNQIPLGAQIIAVCDVFDALTTERTFRAAYSSFEALKLMKREMGDQLAVRYIDALIRLLKR